MTLSIRLRLTLLYSVILALTLIVFGVVLYNVVSQVSLRASQSSLETQADSFLSTGHIHVNPDGTLNIFFPPDDIGSPQMYAQVRAPDGTVADRSPALQSAGYTL